MCACLLLADKANDVATSVAVHDGVTEAPEDHGGGKLFGYDASGFIKSVVYGGLDGIVSIFAIVASVVGASLPLEVIILTGFAKLLGDAISMGCGDALSEWAEQKSIRGEHARETWEMQTNPEGEIKEMVDIYVKKVRSCQLLMMCQR